MWPRNRRVLALARKLDSPLRMGIRTAIDILTLIATKGRLHDEQSGFDAGERAGDGMSETEHPAPRGNAANQRPDSAPDPRSRRIGHRARLL
jgi:hypothetical protein